MSSAAPDDRELIYFALNGYANWLETEDFVLSAVDAQNVKKKFKALTPEQMRSVLRLRELAEACLQAKHVVFKK